MSDGHGAISAATSAVGAVGHVYGSRNKGKARTKVGEYKQGLGEHK